MKAAVAVSNALRLALVPADGPVRPQRAVDDRPRVVSDRLPDARSDELAVVGMNELHELRVAPAECARLESEEQLVALREVEPTRDEIELPRPHPARVEREPQALLGQPERLVGLLPVTAGLDLVELPDDRRH